MNNEDRISMALLTLRLAVFLVMLVWTLDKFFNPAHSAGVYAYFYGIGGLGKSAMAVIGGIELIIIVGFLLGFMKRYTYGFVLLVHTISTLSSYKQYFSPYAEANILFFAAWPMLAACFTLYYLRDMDTRYVIGR